MIDIQYKFLHIKIYYKVKTQIKEWANIYYVYVIVSEPIHGINKASTSHCVSVGSQPHRK